MYEELDAEVLSLIARRLSAESADAFRTAHQLAMESFNDSAADEKFQTLGRAIDREKEALVTQREAMESHKEAWNIMEKRFNGLRASKKCTDETM